jgi:hypothetical protein
MEYDTSSINSIMDKHDNIQIIKKMVKILRYNLKETDNLYQQLERIKLMIKNDESFLKILEWIPLNENHNKIFNILDFLIKMVNVLHLSLFACGKKDRKIRVAYHFVTDLRQLKNFKFLELNPYEIPVIVTLSSTRGIFKYINGLYMNRKENIVDYDTLLSWDNMYNGYIIWGKTKNYVNISHEIVEMGKSILNLKQK